MTPPLISAVKRIAPHFNLREDERSRKAWEADQNGSCWSEYETLAPILNIMPKPRRVLEIGPGLGRSAIFFSKILGWNENIFHLYEGNGATTRYSMLGPRMDSFCGDIKQLKSLLDHNEVNGVDVIDAREVRLHELPGAPYDFIYSFYAIGFHWSLAHFVDDILALMHEHSIAVFTVPSNFTPFRRLKDLTFLLFEWEPDWPKNIRHKLLAISHSAIRVERSAL